MVIIELQPENNDVDISLEKENDVDIELQSDVQEVVTSDYRELTNKPTLNGNLIIGNVDETDPTVPEWAKKPNKPEYNAEDVGAVDEDNIITLEEINSWFNNI